MRTFNNIRFDRAAKYAGLGVGGLIVLFVLTRPFSSQGLAKDDIWRGALAIIICYLGIFAVSISYQINTNQREEKRNQIQHGVETTKDSGNP